MAYVTAEEVITAFYNELYIVNRCPDWDEGESRITIEHERKQKKSGDGEYLSATIYDTDKIILPWIYAKLTHDGKLLLLRKSILEKAELNMEVLSKPWGHKYCGERSSIKRVAQALQ